MFEWFERIYNVVIVQRGYLGVQIAAGMPLEIGEPSDFMSFRIGLFGIDKLLNIDRTVENFKAALEKIH